MVDNSSRPSRYVENPLLFVISSDSTPPKGRNVRIQARAQQAVAMHATHRRAQSDVGRFGVLEFNVKHHRDEEDDDGLARAVCKRRNISGPVNVTNAAGLLQPRPLTTPPSLHNPLASWAPMPYVLSQVRHPSNVLVVATFHIRRVATQTLERHPERLAEVLRCRQWSCVSPALDKYGSSPCLDSALICLAAKLDRLIGGPTSSYAVLSKHTRALQELQKALTQKTQPDLSELLTTTQLLAIFEMIDSLDNAAWTKHVAGAESLLQSRMTKFAMQSEEILSFETVAPMIVDALLSGSDIFLREYDWRASLAAFRHSCHPFNASEDEMICCLIEVPQLHLDASAIDRSSNDARSRYRILDEAHTLKIRMHRLLLKSELLSQLEFNKVTSFGMLNLCLACLVALDRLIADLRPAKPVRSTNEDDETSELCAHFLKLELGASDADPSKELMAAFQLST